MKKVFTYYIISLLMIIRLALYQTQLFQQIIQWHLSRNGLKNNYQQASSNKSYNLTFSTPSNAVADSRKFFLKYGSIKV